METFFRSGKGRGIDKALYLVQHGKSLPEETDPEPGLSKEGIAEII
jgi:phosphohistidine phosphatase SixA